MASDIASTRPRGRPPINENRVAVLEATRSVVSEVGYDRLTLEAVAQRAGLYRRYINRTWSSKAELVRDALFDEIHHFDIRDQSDLQAELRELVSQQVGFMTRPEFVRGIGGLEAEFRLHPELFDSTVKHYVVAVAEAAAAVFGRAVSRGDLEEVSDPMVPVTVVSGAVQQAHAIGIHEHERLVDIGVAVLLGGVLTRPDGR